ncbi:MAG: amino acid ABC transporter ATP-binding protein, partial [Clostridia bacterium]|nr:amino acid ABC transporter ATP-binding protein [Clostridia bacterium]
MPTEPIIQISHLQKQFGDHRVLDDINLSVSKGEVVSVIGASGSGKSTMLRCINLLETPTSGEIRYHGVDITSKENDLRKYRAHVGMVFQQFNLFNNMTALENCTVGQIKVLGRSKDEAKETALTFLRKV